MEIVTTHIARVRKNSDEWNRLLLQQELKTLKREQTHLSSKSIERPLSTWESTRMRAIADDMMKLLAEFTAVASDAVKAITQ